MGWGGCGAAAGSATAGAGAAAATRPPGCRRLGCINASCCCHSCHHRRQACGQALWRRAASAGPSSAAGAAAAVSKEAAWQFPQPPAAPCACHAADTAAHCQARARRPALLAPVWVAGAAARCACAHGSGEHPHCAQAPALHRCRTSRDHSCLPHRSLTASERAPAALAAAKRRCSDLRARPSRAAAGAAPRRGRAPGACHVKANKQHSPSWPLDAPGRRGRPKTAAHTPAARGHGQLPRTIELDEALAGSGVSHGHGRLLQGASTGTRAAVSDCVRCGRAPSPQNKSVPHLAAEALHRLRAEGEEGGGELEPAEARCVQQQGPPRVLTTG